MKITRVGAKLFYADGQNRHDETNSRFSKFCEST